jgi:hypothetical protein
MFTLRCTTCGALANVHGWVETDTNATIINPHDKLVEWNLPEEKRVAECPWPERLPPQVACDHEDFDVVDEWYDDA